MSDAVTKPQAPAKGSAKGKPAPKGQPVTDIKKNMVHTVEKPSSNVTEALKVHSRYLFALNLFHTWDKNPDYVAARWLAARCEGLRHFPEVFKHIDDGALQRHHIAYFDCRKFFVGRIDAELEQLKKLWPKLKPDLEKLGSKGALAYAQLTEGLSQSTGGSAILEGELGKKEESYWETLKDAGKCESVAKKAGEVNEAAKNSFEASFFSVIAELGAHVVRTRHKETVQWFAETVSHRMQISASTVKKVETLQRNGRMKDVVLLKGCRMETLHDVHSWGGAKLSGQVFAQACKAVAVINLGVKINELVHENNKQNAVGFAGALASVLQGFDLTREWARFRITHNEKALGAIEGLETSGKIDITAGKAVLGRQFGAYVVKDVAEHVSPLGVISGTCDLLVGSKNAYDKYGDGDVGGSAAAGVGAAGGGLVAVGSILAMSGLCTGATGVGLPVGVVLLGVGTILGAAGAVWGLFCSQSPIEKWAHRSAFGKNPAPWTGEEAKRQVEQLEAILCSARAMAKRVAGDEFEITIEPSNLTLSSVVKVAVWGEPTDLQTPNEHLHEVVVSEKTKLKGKQLFHIESTPEHLVKAIRFRLTCPDNAFRHRLRIEMQLDPEGEGHKRHKRMARCDPFAGAWVEAEGAAEELKKE